MKKIPHFLLILIGIAAVLVLTLIFGLLFISVGEISDKTTLFYLLKNIDYESLGLIFAFTALYLFILESIIIGVIVVWRKTTNSTAKYTDKNKLYCYWLNYRKIHLTFILLTVFLTIALAAPSSVMNTFTAVVSISVLVSNLTKKIGKE